MKTLPLSSIIERPRKCEVGWLAFQCRDLALIAEHEKNGNALVYACLEARNAIEQLWCEIYLLVKGGSITKEEFERLKKQQDGWAAAIKAAEPRYRKLTQFAAIVMKLDARSPCDIVVWDFTKLRRLWNKLSDYCHAQGHHEPTLDNPDWMDHGLKLVHEAFHYLSEQLKGSANGVLRPENMTANTRMIWDDFAHEKIDMAQVETRLRIIAPHR